MYSVIVKYTTLQNIKLVKEVAYVILNIFFDKDF